MPSSSKNKTAGDAEIRRPTLLALTRGDPSGIGPELALRAWLALHEAPSAPAFFIIADPAHLAGLAERFALPVPIKSCKPDQAATIFCDALPVVGISSNAQGRVHGLLGHPDVADANGTLRSIETAAELIRAGQAAAMVTNPIAKDVLQDAGFAHQGHTEFLGELAQRLFADHLSGAPVRPIMLLWSTHLAVVPATIHVPLAQVPRLVTFDLLVETGKIVAQDFIRRFGLVAPRLVFSGLNPHAGENGHMGREDIDIIKPAVAELRNLGIDARGPFPADTLFHAAARTQYDVAIAMYHDQALIPIKTLAFETAVNVTLGLPFVRTSPDHGTAFDIAAAGKADPSSLIAALHLAARLAQTEPLQSKTA
ncbi:4-hydroxythreonine-4-phosphate dehydrogenase PdxA [Methylovirgula sp. HY1]|uniref:4-hydroxythreonine-4-phosphate dehydrogenase PdxA n=1 Tax=Methylovirgula sp. HY1 TaxID=2822761 RepID=UPI001C5BEAD4|nr:4-hydroxythreonine-4-phosphate dehydrogenase PdxA [Methylovirgula sp. HY1]QXX74357.1 4-hydroxythreonine-4-phosphate dehydrogenase [Methylovirgula sp. HY1]